jgi:head-tail adaptor
MSIASMSNVTATVQRKTITRDAFGATLESWATSSTESIALQPLSGSKANEYDREEWNVSHHGYASGSPDIVLGDRLSISSETYLIRAVLDIDTAGLYLKLVLEQEI